MLSREFTFFSTATTRILLEYILNDLILWKGLYYIYQTYLQLMYSSPSISVNQYLPHNLGYKQKIQAIRRNQVYISSSNVSTDTTVIVKD